MGTRPPWPTLSPPEPPRPAPTSRSPRRPDERNGLGHPGRLGRHRLRLGDLHGPTCRPPSRPFAEQTGRRCIDGTWRDKVAAGFTNSGGKSGDKLNTLVSLSAFAAQHHMHWVNLGLGPGWNSSAGSEHDLNRLAFFLGAGAQTDVDANSDQVHPADVRTCRHLGWRVAHVTRQLNVGRGR